MTNNIRWGLDSLHPLSQMKTELIWDGKYDEYGNRRTVDIAGCAMLRIECGRKSVRAISRKVQGKFCTNSLVKNTPWLKTARNTNRTP